MCPRLAFAGRTSDFQGRITDGKRKIAVLGPLNNVQLTVTEILLN